MTERIRSFQTAAYKIESQLTCQGERVIHFCEFFGDQLTSNLPCITDLMLDYRTRFLPSLDYPYPLDLRIGSNQ